MGGWSYQFLNLDQTSVRSFLFYYNCHFPKTQANCFPNENVGYSWLLGESDGFILWAFWHPMFCLGTYN